MKPKLSIPERQRLIQRSLKGEPVAKLCRDAGISRVLFYRWLGRYKEAQGFRNLKRRVKPSLLINTAVTPKKGAISHRPQFPVVVRIRAITEVVNKKHPVSEVCRELNISKTIFYRWLKRYQEAGVKEPVILASEVRARPGSAQDSDSGLARMTKRIGETVFDEHRALAALEDKKPRIDRYTNQVKEEYEQLILDAVAHYPELSSHKLVHVLPMVGNRPVVGYHGVQNVLRRHDLGTYEKRLAFAKEYSKVPAVRGSIIRTVTSLLTQVGTLPFRTRSRLLAGLAAFFIPITASVITLGVWSYVKLYLTAPNLAIGIGYVFASIALTLGMFFFLYSMKYYLSVILVLMFSRSVAKEGNESSVVPSSALETGSHQSSDHNSPNSPSYFKRGLGGVTSSGLIPDISSVTLDRHPFISIHLPLYNEKRVVNRLLEAVTSMDYDQFEVIVADDSKDGTEEIVREWANHPRIKISHRETRQGFKGGALREALKLMDPRTEFVLVFDSDFLPYPDTITQFLKYFKATAGTLDMSRQTSDFSDQTEVHNSPNSPSYLKRGLGGVTSHLTTYNLQPTTDCPVAAIQGYQWHVLNKSENWITRGVRSEYAGSYVVERSSAEIYQGLKQIAGSVYMIRADILKHYGWGDSITEDFELTLKLYADGYKVVYTPYIQAPSECVSTLKRLVRQRMRWAEGHSHNIKRMFREVLFGRSVILEARRADRISSGLSNSSGDSTSPAQPDSFQNDKGRVWTPSKLSVTEKFEFLYLSPYYLQSFFFLIGTFSWFIAEAVFRVRLPFWTEVWGWSLVLTNMLSLPLMNVVGMFLEEAEEKDYLGVFSFVLMTYIVAPFQAYAAVKGFLEPKEGPWFRTPKTGHITDVFKRGRFYRWLSGIFPTREPAVASVGNHSNRSLALVNANFPDRLELNDPGSFLLSHKYLSLRTANNRFNSFSIVSKKKRWVGKLIFSLLLTISVTVYSGTKGVPEVLATNPSGTFLLYNDASAVITGTTSWQLVDTGTPDTLDITTTASFAKNGANGVFIEWNPGANNSTGETANCSDTSFDGTGWVFDTIFQAGTIASGTWSFTIRESDDNANPTVHWDVCAWQVTVSGGSITSAVLLFETFDGTNHMSGWPTTDIFDAAVSNPTATTATVGPFTLTNEYIYVEYYVHGTADTGQGGTRSVTFATGDVTETNDPSITTPALTIPENALLFLAAAPIIPALVHLWLKSKRRFTI